MRSVKRNGAAWLTAALGLWAASATAASAAEKIAIGGVERSYHLHIPARLAGQRAPLVVVLHGGGGDGAGMRGWAGMDAVADREGSIVAYPDGLDKGWADGRRDFNATRWRGAPPDDVAFLTGLVEREVAAGRADAARVYVMGASNGGMMTMRLACETAGVFAGFAAVIANLPVDQLASCRPAAPLRMLVMNGTRDTMVPFAGGKVGFRGERGVVVSTADTIAFWRKAAGCAGAGQPERLPDLDLADGSHVEVTRAADCPAGSAVTLYTVIGGGHQMPSRTRGPRLVMDRLFGPPNRDIEAAEAIWAFFAGRLR